TRRKLLAQGSCPAGGDDEIDHSALLHFGKGPRCCAEAGSGACGNPLTLIEAPAPEINALRAFMPPAAYQQLQFAGHGSDYGNSRHGAYPCARNHSIAAFIAGLMGRMWKPSSCCACALEAYIFLRPMRTSSSVARGSRPRMRPVIHSSKNA